MHLLTGTRSRSNVMLTTFSSSEEQHIEQFWLTVTQSPVTN